MAEPEIVKARWAEQVKTVAKMCPSLTTLNISTQPSILLNDADAYEVWSPLASQISTGVPGYVPCLRDLSIYNSCWSDVSGLLKVAGDKLERLNLMLRREINLVEDRVPFQAIRFGNLWVAKSFALYQFI